MSVAEIMERRRIEHDLAKACVVLDLDGLRFVLCVAQIRGMNAEELGKVQAILVERFGVASAGEQDANITSHIGA